LSVSLRFGRFSDIPAPGTAWADASPFDRAAARPAGLLLADACFTVVRIIVQEFDRGAGFMSFSPRVMINQQDRAATGSIQPASHQLPFCRGYEDAQAVKAYVQGHAEIDKLGVGHLRGVFGLNRLTVFRQMAQSWRGSRNPGEAAIAIERGGGGHRGAQLGRRHRPIPPGSQ
jgi:hypothetical protein